MTDEQESLDAKVAQLEDDHRRKTAKLYGLQPKPRLLIWGEFDWAKQTASQLGDLFPTIQAVEYLSEVDPSEFDVLLTLGSAAGSLDDLCTVVLGGCHVRPNTPGGKTTRPPIQYNQGTVSKHFFTGENLPEEIGQELIPSLMKTMRMEPSNSVLEWDTRGIPHERRNSLPVLSRVMEPFVWTAREEILAGRFDRPGGKSECWVLPYLALKEIKPWMEAALRLWEKRFPDAFPIHQEWAQSEAWMTPEQKAIEDQRASNEVARQASLGAFNEKAAALDDLFEKETQRASSGPLRLLHAKGEELVAAVEEALTYLSFAVTNMDPRQPEGNKVEDLRVDDPSGWTALVEVKGYPGGAKSNDLLLFSKWVGPFAAAERRPPDACWLVANQFAGQNPTQRPPALASKEAELQTFAEASNGLVVDTAELFRLWKAVALGRLTAEDARKLLMETRGRFTYSMPEKEL